MITPQKHAENLRHLVSIGEWDDKLHRRFHQSNWYDWTCNSVETHLRWLEKHKPKRILGANQTYAVLIQALVDHIQMATIKTRESA